MSEETPRLERRELTRYLLGSLISLAISVGILALLYMATAVQIQTVITEWAGADKGKLLLAVVFSAVSYFSLGPHKLWLILRNMGVDISLRETLFVRLGEGPLKVLMPLKGGELLTVVFFWRYKRLPMGNAAGALAFDKGLNLLGNGLWLLVGVSLVSGMEPSLRVLAVIALGLFAVAFLFLSPLHNGIIRVAGRLSAKVGRFVRGLLMPWREFSSRRKIFFLVYGVVWVTRPFFVCYLLFAAYGIYPRLQHIVLYTTMATFAGAVPGPMVGIGPRETVIAGMFAGYLPVGSSAALSVGFLMTLSLYLAPYLLGVPWLPWFLGRLVARRAASADG